MECVVLVRMSNDDVIGITDGDRLYTLPDIEAAIDFAEGHSLCQRMGYQVVELDEL